MKEIFINECTLTDRSKVYDVVVRDFEQGEGEDCLRFNCASKEQAECFVLAISEAIAKCGDSVDSALEYRS